MAIAILCGFVIQESPINAIQVLWINVIMDSFSSLALATEPPTEELLTRVPVKKRDPIINRAMWNAICFQAICQYILLLLVLFLSPSILGIQSSIHMVEYSAEKAVHYTFFFNCFVYLQVFNFINARTLKKSEVNPFHNICSNHIFWLIIVLTIVGQFIFVEAFGRPVRCTPLPLKLHLISIFIGSFALLFAYLEKITPDNLISFPMIIKEKEEVSEAEVSKGLMGLKRSGLNRSKRSGIIN